MSEDSEPADWRAECERVGLDPNEVRKVSARYNMYRDYTLEQTGDCLPLERWYKWYRVEKLSEGHATSTPPAADCSVGPDAAAPAPVVSGPEFLRILELCRDSDHVP